MFVGIDVHKHQHAAALIDERGGELGTLTFPTAPRAIAACWAGWASSTPSRRWSGSSRRAAMAASSSGRWPRPGSRCCTCRPGAPIASATAKGRARPTPATRSRSPTSSAASAASSARRMEPELVRALAMLELQRRRFVRDRTQAIQRLRSDWTQQDPVAEAGALRCNSQRELRRLKRIRFGDSLTDQIAARCIRELARDIEDLNQRIAALDREIAELLDQHDNPLADLQGAGTNLTATIIAQAGDVRRFRDAAAFARFCGAAPIPCGSGQTAGRHRLHRGGNRQLNAALYRIAIVQQRHHPDAKAFLARKHAEGKTPTRSPPRAQTPPRQRPLPTASTAWADNTPAMNVLT